MYTFLDIKVDNIIPIIINKNMYFFFREKKALFTKKRITKEIITAFIKFALSPDIQIQITIKQKNIFDNIFFLELFLKDLNKKPETKNPKLEGLILALDSIRDPGNLGTIIRLCDWFGIETLLCSEETVDVYNPKVVQATMGSISRVKVVYCNLEIELKKAKIPVFGTFMDGKSVYSENLPKEGIIVMGNEANGISSSIEKIVSERISIPRFGNLQLTESLNVATATAIILNEFKRPV